MDKIEKSEIREAKWPTLPTLPTLANLQDVKNSTSHAPRGNDKPFQGTNFISRLYCFSSLLLPPSGPGLGERTYGSRTRTRLCPTYVGQTTDYPQALRLRSVTATTILAWTVLPHLEYGFYLIGQQLLAPFLLDKCAKARRGEHRSQQSLEKRTSSRPSWRPTSWTRSVRRSSNISSFSWTCLPASLPTRLPSVHGLHSRVGSFRSNHYSRPRVSISS